MSTPSTPLKQDESAKITPDDIRDLKYDVTSVVDNWAADLPKESGDRSGSDSGDAIATAERDASTAAAKPKKRNQSSSSSSEGSEGSIPHELPIKYRKVEFKDQTSDSHGIGVSSGGGVDGPKARPPTLTKQTARRAEPNPALKKRKETDTDGEGDSDDDL